MSDTVTYEDIYELLRAEKASSDLEDIKLETLDKIRAYLLAKNKLLSQQKEGMFSGIKERIKILAEIESVRGAMKDLFEKRERKVVNRAIYTVRTELKMRDTTNMLPSEVELYNALVILFEKDKKFLDNILENLEIPLIAPTVEEPVHPEPIEKELEFLDDVPELVCSDLKRRGPFSRGSKGTLPIDLAELLIEQRRARAL